MLQILGINILDNSNLFWTKNMYLGDMGGKNEVIKSYSLQI